MDLVKGLGTSAFTIPQANLNRVQKPYSEDTGKLIDEEVRKLVEDCYLVAQAILTQHKEELIALATLLLEKEVVFKDEIESVLGKRGLIRSSKLAIIKS